MIEDLKLFNELVDVLLEDEKEHPVANPVQPQDLYHKLDLSLRDEPMVDSDFKKVLSDLIRSTPKTASTSFFNQLFGGRISRATLGDLLAVMLNTSMYTYKVAGPHVGIEKTIIQKICELVGYGPESDGTIAAGGSMSNYMAMVMARDQTDPDVRHNGITRRMTLYTSDASHYSIVKNASLIGIGRAHVRFVKTDHKGQMLSNHLELLIKEDLASGYLPFFVNATAGTTVLGAFDDIKKISSVCKKHNLWLHLDGAYCGSVIFSEQYKGLVDGIELTDSFSLNAHKMLGTPLTCSIIITQHKNQLLTSFSNEADYLYQTDNDQYNLGKTSFQCGRRNDALKLWTLWKSIGSKGLEQIVNHQFEMADIARRYINSHVDYTLYSHDDSISVCFKYKNYSSQKLCQQLYENSQLMVSYGHFKSQEFVRLVTINSTVTSKDVLRFFEILEEFANTKYVE